MFLFQVVIYLSGFRIFCFVNQISSCCFNVCLACWVVLENLFGYWEREKLGTWAGIFGVFVFLFCVCLCVVSFWGSVISLCLFKFFEFQYYSALVTFLFVGFFPYSKNGYFSISFFILDHTNLVKYINLSVPLFWGD